MKRQRARRGGGAFRCRQQVIVGAVGVLGLCGLATLFRSASQLQAAQSQGWAHQQVRPLKSVASAESKWGPWVLAGRALNVELGLADAGARRGLKVKQLRWHGRGLQPMAFKADVAFKDQDMFVMEIAGGASVRSSDCTLRTSERLSRPVHEACGDQQPGAAASSSDHLELVFECPCGASCSGGVVLQVHWSARLVEGPHGTALRWRLSSDGAPRSAHGLGAPVAIVAVSMAMWMFGAKPSGIVDGSPLVASAWPPLRPGRGEGEHSIAAGRPVTTSAAASDKKDALVDDNPNTEWFAPKKASEAWVEVDLGQLHNISGVKVYWWAVSRAKHWKLEAAGKEREFLRVAEGPSPGENVPGFNEVESVRGWSSQTQYIRLTMRGGHVDPWGFDVNLGIRELAVSGRPTRRSLGYREGLWAGNSSSPSSVPPGLWLALEHPRSRCWLEPPADDEADTAVGPRADKGLCKLWLPTPSASDAQGSIRQTLDVHGSIGFFEEGASPPAASAREPQPPTGGQDAGGVEAVSSTQLRRAFLDYIQCVRGKSLEQLLHYNSWYDLRGGGWSHLKFKHDMTYGACAVRLEAINGNFTARGAGALDAFMLDDGWDDWDSLWEVSPKRFPGGFTQLLGRAARWGTVLGLWMSPFGGYEQAAARRLAIGKQMGLETHPGRGFALAGPRYFAKFTGVAHRRLREGFRMFKFDGLGGGLGQNGAGEFVKDFEAMLQLIQELRNQTEHLEQELLRGQALQERASTSRDPGGSAQQRRAKRRLWINLTIGTWPSIFWLLWADSIWRDGIDVGVEGEGTLREKWLTFRDASVLRALQRGPVFPLPAFMQHGLVWSRTSMAADLWDLKHPGTHEDFRKEALTFFLSGVGLQELYLQLELMDPQHWEYLAEMVTFARRHARLLRDAHWIGGNPSQGKAYGVASFGPGPLDDEPAPLDGSPQAAGGSPAPVENLGGSGVAGVLYWRNPSPNPLEVRFTPALALELPTTWLHPTDGRERCWAASDLRLRTAQSSGRRRTVARVTPGGVASGGAVRLEASEELRVSLGPFEVHALALRPTACQGG